MAHWSPFVCYTTCPSLSAFLSHPPIVSWCCIIRVIHLQHWTFVSHISLHGCAASHNRMHRLCDIFLPAENLSRTTLEASWYVPADYRTTFPEVISLAKYKGKLQCNSPRVKKQQERCVLCNVHIGQSFQMNCFCNCMDSFQVSPLCDSNLIPMMLCGLFYQRSASCLENMSQEWTAHSVMGPSSRMLWLKAYMILPPCCIFMVQVHSGSNDSPLPNPSHWYMAMLYHG